jgi:hypothetical protein
MSTRPLYKTKNSTKISENNIERFEEQKVGFVRIAKLKGTNGL